MALLSRSAASRALKAGSGRSHRSRATSKSSTSSGSAAGRAPRGSARIAPSACASRSIRSSSLMVVPHAGPQRLERAELKLLDRAFRPSEFAGDFANALLLDEARQDDPSLITRQATDELGQHGLLVDVGRNAVGRGLGQRLPPLTRRALPAISQRVPGDAEQPSGKGRAAPLEPTEMGQSVVEDLGGNVLGLAAMAGPAGDERVDAIEVSLVELGEAARVALGRLDQDPLVLALRGNFGRRCPSRHRVHTL